MIGVLISSSCLRALSEPGSGLIDISDGKVADLGVWSGGRTGFATAAGMMTDLSSSEWWKMSSQSKGKTAPGFVRAVTARWRGRLGEP